MSDNPFSLAKIQQSNEKAPASDNPFAMQSIQRDQNQDLRNNLKSAVQADPVKTARADDLAKQRDLPTDVVLRNLLDVELQDAVDKADEKLKTDPTVLKRFRESPLYAKKAKDDIDALIKTNGEFRAWNGPEPTMTNIAVGLAKALPQAGMAVREGLRAQMGDFLEWTGLIERSPAYKASQQRTLDQAINARNFTTPDFKSSTAGAIYGGVDSTLRMVPGLVASVVSRSPTPLMISAGVQTQAESYGKYRSRGGEALESFMGANLEAAIEVATEYLPTKFLTQALGKKGVGEFITGLLAREIPGEQLATLLQDAVDTAVANPNKTWGEYLAERPEAAYQTLVSTVTQSAIMGGASKAVNMMASETGRAEQAQQGAERLANVFKLAAETQLRQHSPVDFKQTINDYLAANPSAPAELYLDAEVLNQMSPEVLNQLPGVAEQMEAALAANSVVSIKMSDALLVAPGTPLQQMMVENARIGDVTAMSQAESKEAGTKAQEFLAQESQRVIQQAVDQQAMQESSDRVKEGLLKQLNTVGRFRKEVNEGYATWATAFYTTMAGRMNTTPEAMAAEFPLRITGKTGQGSVLNTSENALPIMYHGGLENFGSKGNSVARADRYRPFWITPDKSLAESYGTARGGQVTELFADIQNPADLNAMAAELLPLYNSDEQMLADNPDAEWTEDDGNIAGSAYLLANSAKVMDYLAEKGYDSVTVEERPGVKSYGILDPKQVRLASDETLKQSPAIRSGDEEAPERDAEIEKALAAESDDAREITQSDVPESVDAGATLNSTLSLAKSKVWQKGRDLKVAMQNAVQELARAAGVDVGAPSPQTTEYLTRIGVKDALFALEQNANAVGWYDLKTRQALAVMSLIHPEIAKDETAQLAFVWAMAVTSNGLKVDKNFEIAEKAYREYKRTGNMPTDAGIGTAGGAINKSLAQFNDLLAQWGPADLRKFMLSDFTVSEITGVDKALKPGGEHADVVVKGAAILGPKIGNGFFSNLFGNFDSLTMDRWLIRTWGRWSGTLIKAMPQQTAKAQDRLSAVLVRITASEAETQRLSDAIKTPITNGMSVDALATAIQEASMDPAVRAVMNETEIGLEMRKAGNSLAKYLDGQKEAPAGPNERKYIREVFGNILTELKQDPRYTNLTMADLQAVLWYAEKRLYESAKQDLTEDDDVDGYSDEDAPDYANAAAAVARAAGISERKISNALKKEQDSGRTGNARSGDEPAGQSQSAEQATPAGFTRSEKREFIAREAVHRIRSNRVGDDQQSWSYAGASGGRREKPGLLKALGVTVVDNWKLGGKAANVFKANSLKYPKFVELDSQGGRKNGPSNAQRFAELITASKMASGSMGAAVYVYPAEDYASMRLFLAEDGKSGVAIKPDGDIVSVFGGGGTGHAVMELAVAAGGIKLDAFQTILPEFYSAHGFAPVARLTWDDSQAPDGWDKAALARYNNGEPDVVFMALDTQFFGRYDAKMGRRMDGDDAYDKALAAQRRAVNKVAKGGVLNQGPRGTFNTKNMELALNENADLSTFLHETGHFFLEVMADLAARPGAPADIQSDMNVLMKWFGIADVNTWNNYTLDQKRPYHERFAESFEQYLLEGKAPSLELQPLFRKFRAWMLNVYKSLKSFVDSRTGATNIQLSDEVRQVFDRMLASEAQIAEANEVAGLLPDQEADAEAVEKLTARSLRDLKWTVNARAREIKKLQKQAAELRKGVEADIQAEVEQEPIYKAMRWLKKGETTDEAGNLVKAEKGFRLDTSTLAEMYPETMLARPDLAGLRGMTMKDGLHPDIVADMFGFESGDALVRSLLAAEPLASVVQGMTDQRMLEQYGDLVDQRAIEAAANEAVHNEARARSLATELKSQGEAMNARTDTGQVNAKGSRITVNAIVEAAKQFAANVVAKTPLRDLKSKAQQHTAAERRAGKRWQEHTTKGETAEAIKAKQDQVLNNAAAKAAIDAQEEMRKILTFFKRVIKDNNEKTVEKGRDPDVVNAARAILGAYGIAPKGAKTAAEYMDLVAKNDLAMFAALQPSVQGALNLAQPLDALTMDELRGLHEEIQAMWHLAKRSRQMEVDGNLMDMQDAEDELQARMQEIGVPDSMPGETSAVTPREKAQRALQFAGSLLRRTEQWAAGMGSEFTKLVFQPVKDAANRYRADRVKYRKAYQGLVDAVAPHLAKGPIDAPEINYTFGKGHNGIGHAELLHAILHTGNASNKRKLLLGRGWATENADGTLDTTRWDNFIQRMHSNGVLTGDHYAFAQGVWDLLEQTKPLAQKTHRDVFGRYFAEVTADEFTTPFGTYRGGYVPAQADPSIVQDAALRDLASSENENMAFSFPGTNKGFTKGRVEYNRPLMLDLRTIGQHIDKVLLFSHMEPAVRDVNKLLSRKGVSRSLGRIDPTIYAGMLTPWLNRSARQIVETPIVGDGGISRVLSAARNRAGMALMFGNVSNALQQLTGFSTAFSKLKADGLDSHMMRATAQFIASPKQTAKAVADLSPFMASRMENEISAINDAMDAILLDPNLYQKAQAWTQKHAYFLQSALANTMEPIIWNAGYNGGLEKGMTEAEAARYADGLIRQTQGSTLPEDVSRIETGPAYARVFTQFIGYFNMMANTNATALKQIAEETGLKKGAGKALMVVTFGFMVPIWVAEAIALAMRGGPEDEDDDGYLDDWLAAVFGMGTIKGIFASVPFVGQLANASINRFNGNPADDKMSLSPAVSLLEAAVGVPVDVYKAIADPDKLNKRNAVRDVASAVSIATGLPAVALARPLGYLAGIDDGKIEPTSAGDMARGLVTGTPSPDSK